VRHAAIRGLVPAAQLRAAYTQEEARSHAATLAGRPLGGLLFAVGPAVPFVVDALSFAAALAGSALARVPRRPPTSAVRVQQGMVREVAEVLRWIGHRPGLRALYFLLTALNLIGGAFMIPLIVLVGERGAGPAGTGAVLAGAGVGGVVGALAAPVVGRVLPVGRMMVAIVAVFGAAVAAMALPLGPWWPIVPLAVVTLVTPSINVVVNAVTARMVPQDMQGRTESVLVLVARGLAPLGPVLGGALAAGLGAAGALVLVGGALLSAAAVAAATGELRRFTEEAD
jgi:predicted MFS family arabinose efflux permease